MNNKGVAKLSTYLIALIVLGMVFTGLISMMSIANQEEADFLVGNETGTYNDIETKFGSILNDTIDDNEDFKNSVNATQQDAGAFGFLDSLVSTGFSTFKNIFSSYSIISTGLTGVGALGLGIPSWVGAALLSMIVILIAFGIYRFIFKVDG